LPHLHRDWARQVKNKEVERLFTHVAQLRAQQQELEERVQHRLVATCCNMLQQSAPCCALVLYVAAQYSYVHSRSRSWRNRRIRFYHAMHYATTSCAAHGTGRR
jgi:hypothetical protein